MSSDLDDAYAAKLTGNPNNDPCGYNGQSGYYTDSETGLILCTYRSYDPGNGRWLTRDPIGYDGGINLYGYVGNDPINERDPSGLAKIITLKDVVKCSTNCRKMWFPTPKRFSECMAGCLINKNWMCYVEANWCTLNPSSPTCIQLNRNPCTYKYSQKTPVDKQHCCDLDNEICILTGGGAGCDKSYKNCMEGSSIP